MRRPLKIALRINPQLVRLRLAQEPRKAPFERSAVGLELWISRLAIAAAAVPWPIDPITALRTTRGTETMLKLISGEAMKSINDATAARQFETACRADIGGRDEQQDRVAVFASEEAQLLVLADGLGGHEGGALAAQAVIDVAHERFEVAGDGAPGELLKNIVESAHERILELGAEHGASPHSTCVLLHIDATRATWMHVGDSRLYRFESDHLAERTLDHSVVELMRLQGRIDEDEMKSHPDQNKLFEALGGDGSPHADMGEHAIAPGDGFLLASDGLWENVRDKELAAIFASRKLDRALKSLVAKATHRGGADCDNVSVAVARQGRSSSSVVSRVRRQFSRRSAAT